MSILGLRETTSMGLRDLIGNRSLNAAGLVLATTTSKIKVANTVKYLVGGLFCSYAAADNIAWGTAATTGVELRDLADLETAYYTISVTAAGVIKVNGTTSSSDAVAIFPTVADTALLGILKIVNSQTTPAVFNPGTTLLGVAGLVATFYDYAVLPATETL